MMSGSWKKLTLLASMTVSHWDRKGRSDTILMPVPSNTWCGLPWNISKERSTFQNHILKRTKYMGYLKRHSKKEQFLMCFKITWQNTQILWVALKQIQQKGYFWCVLKSPLEPWKCQDTCSASSSWTRPDGQRMMQTEYWIFSYRDKLCWMW